MRDAVSAGAADTGDDRNRNALPGSLVLVGAGKMGGAMLEGWLAGGLPPERITVVDPAPSADLERLASERRFSLLTQPASTPPPEVVVLAIKPQGLEATAPLLSGLGGPDALLVSILAGKTVADLSRALPGFPAMVRAMPNLPAAIGRGATGAYANPRTNARQREIANTLVAAVGLVEWVPDEDAMDAVTALSGSGPAYLFHLVEAMAEAGVAAGLAPDLAGRLARTTVVGSAALLGSSETPPATLRENVTSPGGTTAAALDVLMGPAGLADLMRRAVAAARRRAAELSG